MTRLLDTHPGPEPASERQLTPEVAQALAELEAARSGVQDSLDELSAAAQSALDVPAKIRRNPVKTVALVGGAGFLLAGGPRRMVRFATSRVRPPKPDPYAGLLPPEIEKVLRDVGIADDPKVRHALDQDFAEYLKSKGRYGPEPTAASSFWRTFDRLAGPLGTASARVLVERIMEADHDRTKARRQERDKARQAGSKSS
jgi:hypothetical protein